MALAGWPKLLTAAYAGQTEEVESILEAKVGADPNETDSLGRTALMHAAAQGHAEVVDVLIEAGIDVVDVLIQAGTDVGFSHSADGRTAL
ncbi:ankyrin repeat-containing domain protein [Baffinella frigidus]|nr:ankyrin repeat-containing domain protein [Cryptophyta sp. CCMP2293]